MSSDLYEIDLERLCSNMDFLPEQVTSACLVFPRGTVANRRLMWIKVELKDQDTRFITRPLEHFYDYVRLPQSSLALKDIVVV